jgi:hypothetical protein
MDPDCNCKDFKVITGPKGSIEIPVWGGGWKAVESTQRKRRNPDIDIRRLEREISTGDISLIPKYASELVRRGLILGVSLPVLQTQIDAVKRWYLYEDWPYRILSFLKLPLQDRNYTMRIFTYNYDIDTFPYRTGDRIWIGRRLREPGTIRSESTLTGGQVAFPRSWFHVDFDNPVDKTDHWHVGSLLPLIPLEEPTARRNPEAGDRGLRNLEREYHQTGSRETWLKLQLARMRSGQPYERTFIEKREEANPFNWEDWPSPDHGENLIKTFLNNGWIVDTWYDENEWGSESRPEWSEDGIIGWTTIVTDAEQNEIGSAVHCGTDDSCGERCHQNKVNDIIAGTIEGYGDDVWVLRSEPPVLL